MTAITNKLGTYYQIPDEVADKKYHGCGNGQIIIDKESDEMLDMDYFDEADWVIKEQNVLMHPDAGEVLNETSSKIVYRANFSCGHACLF